MYNYGKRLVSKLSASLSLTRKGNRTTAPTTPTTPPSTSTASSDNSSDQLNHQSANVHVDNEHKVENRSATLTAVAVHSSSQSHSNHSKQSIVPSSQRRPTSTTAGKKRSRNSNGHTVTIVTDIDAMTMKSNNESYDDNFNKLTNKIDGHKTPMLLFSNDNNTNNSSNPQLTSLSTTVTSNTYNSSSSSPSNKRQKKSGAPIGQSRSLLLDSIPHDVLSNILSFLILPVDYYAIQLTCKEFHKLSDQDDFLKYVDINVNSGCFGGCSNGSGDNENNDATTATNTNSTTTDNDQNQTMSSSSGKGSILYNVQSPVVAVERLYKFANAGSLQALYM